MIALRSAALIAIAVLTCACKDASSTATPLPSARTTSNSSASPSSIGATPIDTERNPALGASAAASASSLAFFGRVPAQPMGYQGAWWLDRAGRDAEQQPEHVLDVIGIHAGQTVADIGCGSGYFSVHLAKRVGETGHVLATDLQPQMLALLDKKARAAKITNITPILATEQDAKLPRASVDVALFVDVYHELAHPSMTMAQVKDALRDGGKVVLVEYRGEDPNVDIKPEHKMTLPQIKKELASESFSFISSDESLPKQRIVTFEPSSLDH